MADSPRRSYSRSLSPVPKGRSRSPSPAHNGRARSPSPAPRGRSKSPSPARGGRSRSLSPAPKGHSRSPAQRGHARSKSQSRSRSRSPRPRSRSLSRSPRRRSRSRSRSRSRADAINPGNTLYVTGLSSRVTERELEDHFSREGKVAECRLIVEPRSRISRGFAFVTMDTTEDANRCIKYLDRSVLEGRHITVEKSKRKRPRTPTPGNYLGLKNTRESSRYERSRYRGGREDYGGYRRSPPRRSPYRGNRDYSPPRRSRRDRSRSPAYSPHRSPERGSYGRRADVYAR